jgi:hypothetical protein
MPSIIQSPFKIPSNTTLRLENGELTTVPPQLKKTTPNFHLVMPAEKDTDAFCKTTLSGMLLHYPPPTIVNLKHTFEDDLQRERDTLLNIRHYLEDGKYVQDEDLVLVVDAESSWFQLPSDVIIKQYARVLEDANARLLKQYGVDKNGYQRFNQSIVFGAEKTCGGDDMACKFAPRSILPANLYGKEDDLDIADRPARYLNSKMVIGPAKDLKMLYQVALGRLDLQHNQRQTIQSVFATMFGEQQLRRDAVATGKETKKPSVGKIKDLFTGTKGKSKSKLKLDTNNPTLSRRYEFSIGLDYTHFLFQPLTYAHEDELIPLVHRNDTDISDHQHPTSWTKDLALPLALEQSNPPFWRADLNPKNNPSPNKKPAYIDALDYKTALDNLPDRKTPWNNLRLLQNTYTGSVPAIIFNDPLAQVRKLDPDGPQIANVTFKDMWFSPYKRALLRNYFRTPQSPLGYHNSLVGGDRAWDMRGGRGGVWTATEESWLAWGEADGVCGSVNQIKEVFTDGRGIWLHEGEEGAEDKRLEEEARLSGKIDPLGFKVVGGDEVKKEKEDKEKKEHEGLGEVLVVDEEEKERQRLKAEQDMKDMEALDRMIMEEEKKEALQM